MVSILFSLANPWSSAFLYPRFCWSVTAFSLSSSSGTPHLWYGHISMVIHHRNHCGHICLIFLLLFVNHSIYLMLFHKMPILCTSIYLQRFCSTFLHPFSTYVSERMCFVIELSLILCRLLSIVQILYHSSASNLCLANVFDMLFSHLCPFVVSPNYFNHRAIYSEW